MAPAEPLPWPSSQSNRSSALCFQGHQGSFDWFRFHHESVRKIGVTMSWIPCLKRFHEGGNSMHLDKATLYLQPINKCPSGDTPSATSALRATLKRPHFLGSCARGRKRLGTRVQSGAGRAALRFPHGTHRHSVLEPPDWRPLEVPVPLESTSLSASLAASARWHAKTHLAHTTIRSRPRVMEQ